MFVAAFFGVCRFPIEHDDHSFAKTGPGQCHDGKLRKRHLMNDDQSLNLLDDQSAIPTSTCSSVSENGLFAMPFMH